jgi:hypothetical protein
VRRLSPQTPWITLIFTAVLLVLAGCSEPPQKEIDQAQAAVDLARTAGAEKYAPEEFAGAATGLQKARTAVDERDYRLALSHAIDARQRAQNANKLAADGQAAAKRAAEAIVTDVVARTNALQFALKSAEDGRVPVKDLRGPRAAMAEAQTSLQEARTRIGAGNYDTATALLAAVRKKLDAAIQDVENIRQRPARTGKGRRR